ncbi:hypothetical protein TYRP_020596 [Tyrophagus putrescentiae]|nr:hypothetical protein TYRP_020596 [Tyrophagus putrescentiae]
MCPSWANNFEICVFGWKTLFGGGSSSSSQANRATSSRSSSSSGTYRVIEGDPNLGSLHSLIRHASQWANVLPSFKSEWSKLPKEARTLVAKVEKGEQPAKGFFESLAKLNLSSKIFSPLEKKTSRFISEHATSSNLVRQGQNSSGQGQRFFSVTDALGRSSELVLGVEGEGKPVITAFFRPASSSSSSSFLGAAFQWVIRNWKTVLVVGFACTYLYLRSGSVLQLNPELSV